MSDGRWSSREALLICSLALKSRRDIWNQLTAAEKRETAEAIQEFRFYHESLEGLRVDIPAGRPADLEDLSPGKEYANSIDVFQDALEAARIASEDLVDVRRRCSSARLASTTCSWLRGLIASFVADYNVVTDEIEEFLAVLDAEKRAIGVRLEAAKRAIQANVEAAKRADEAKVEAAKRARKAQWEKAHPLGTPPPSDDGSDTDHDVAVPPPPSAYWVGVNQYRMHSWRAANRISRWAASLLQLVDKANLLCT